jgi:predicted nucleic acid-binding protein
MPFVLDASTAIDWALEKELQPSAAIAHRRLRTDEARVPSLWWFEVRNVLIMAERRDRLTEADTADFLRGLSRLPIVVDRATNEQALLALARDRRLTVYDAAYLELALREKIPLATLDRALVRAARAEKVALL